MFCFLYRVANTLPMTLDSIWFTGTGHITNLEWQFSKLIVSFESSIGQHTSALEICTIIVVITQQRHNTGGDVTPTNRTNVRDFIDLSPNRYLLFGMLLTPVELIVWNSLYWVISYADWFWNRCRVVCRVSHKCHTMQLEFRVCVFHLWQCQNWMIINFMGASWTPRSFNCLWHFRK